MKTVTKYIFQPMDPETEIHRRFRFLPHWEQEGATYFVTFRTADALPAPKVRELRERMTFLVGSPRSTWTRSDWIEYKRLHNSRMQALLDAGYGACHLKKPGIASIVEGSLRFFDGGRYVLDDFVIMPNHVHMLSMLLGEYKLGDILFSLKSYTATEINKALGLKETFWMRDRHDHFVRSWTQLEHYRRYIQDNPVKAHLREGEYILGTGAFGLKRR